MNLTTARAIYHSDIEAARAIRARRIHAATKTARTDEEIAREQHAASIAYELACENAHAAYVAAVTEVAE